VESLLTNYKPELLFIQPGDTVRWTWAGTHFHSVTSGISPLADGKFGTPLRKAPYTFTAKGRYDYFCAVHIPAIRLVTRAVIVVGPPEARPLNVCTQTRVEISPALSQGAIQIVHFG
jgi:plastocyanin